MSKGIAIQTILLLLVGIIVAGIVIYMVYRYVSSEIISEAECNVRLTEICTLCKNVNWSGLSGESLWSGIVNDCADYSKFENFDGSDDCSDIQTPCKILGVE